MIRTNVFLKKSQIKFLKSINELSLAEHIRRAIDQYISNLRPEKASASASKEGEKNG